MNINRTLEEIDVNKLTDLEICKWLADIEGVSVMMMESAIGANWMSVGKYHGGNRVYNPLEDDALVFRLAFKKKVKIDYFHEDVYIKELEKLDIQRFNPNDITSLRRAICLVVVGAYI
jgi:hypothetical protein